MPVESCNLLDRNETEIEELCDNSVWFKNNDSDELLKSFQYNVTGLLCDDDFVKSMKTNKNNTIN